MMCGLSLLAQSKIATPDRNTINEFYDAIDSGDVAEVKEMLRTKFPATYEPISKVSPLKFAIWEKDIRIVKLLVEGGANINGKESSVEMAAEQGDLSILRYLLAKGAAIQKTSFNTSANHHFYDAAKLLLSRGASQNAGEISGKLWMYLEAVKRGDYEVLKQLKLTEAELNHNDCEGQTALIIAVKKNNIEMVKYLLLRGANKNKPETFDCGDDISYGQKPVQIARKKKYTEMVRVLL